MARPVIVIGFCAFIVHAAPGWSQQAVTGPGDDQYQRMQSDFAVAYNRKDTAAMALFFSEDAIRITPNGILRGRDAIRRDFDKAIAMGLHDYSVRRTITRPIGDLVFNAGEWQGKLGDQPFRGYYSALVKSENGAVSIVEETVTVAAPER